MKILLLFVLLNFPLLLVSQNSNQCGQFLDSKVPTNFYEDALKVILKYESSTNKPEDAYGKITGNYDKTGLSIGLLQWNLQPESLLKLLEDFSEDSVKKYMQHYGTLLWKAVHLPKKEGIEIVKKWQVNSDFPQNSKPKKEIFKMITSKSFIEIQKKHAKYAANDYYSYANCWAKASRGADSCNFQEFLYFFDYGVINDIRLKYWPKFVDSLALINNISQNTIFHWVEKEIKNTLNFGYKDSKKNLIFWNDTNLSNNKKRLFYLLYLVSLDLKNEPKLKLTIMNRRGSILFGKGVVNNDTLNFQSLYKKYNLIEW